MLPILRHMFVHKISTHINVQGIQYVSKVMMKHFIFVLFNKCIPLLNRNVLVGTLVILTTRAEIQ